MMLFHFQVGMDLYVFSKQALRELEGLQQLLTLFNGEHLEWVRIGWASLVSPKGKSLGSHVVG
jgi:hypothetical protein